ncbi:MAG: VOC family protein [Rhodospirillales bacterium]|nr:VOC family protein [Rhodospirillales bacterium]
MGRIVLFVRDMEKAAAFYGDVLGLEELSGPGKDWREFDAGGSNIALHSGGRDKAPPRMPKIVFVCDDVTAERETLNARGARFGKVKMAGDLHLCDGKDPEGHALQLSNRR